MRICGRHFLISMMVVFLFVGTSAAFAQGKGAGAKLMRVADLALKQKKYALAVRKYSEVLDISDVTEKAVAHALYRRAIAYRLSGRYAQSIADTSNALWLGKLNNRQKAEALKSRALAYEAAGFRTKAAQDRQSVTALGGAPVNASRRSKPKNIAISSFTTTTIKSENNSPRPAARRISSEKTLKKVPSFRTTIQPDDGTKKTSSGTGSGNFLSSLFGGEQTGQSVESDPVERDSNAGLSAADWSKGTRVSR